MKKPITTNRERQMLARTGMTDADIANEFSIQVDSVHMYWRKLCKKLGVKTRSAALIKALKLGEIQVRHLIS